MCKPFEAQQRTNFSHSAGFAFLRREHVLFASIIIRSWVQATDLLPHTFFSVCDIIISLQGTKLLGTLLESVLSSEELYMSCLDKCHRFLLDDSFLSQDLSKILQTLQAVMLTLRSYGEQVLGSNYITKCLLSSLASACQRQMCMGPKGDDGNEQPSTIEIVRQVSDSIK